ncbi:chorismate mutase [Cupriavidus basilensis]|uniref:chorismate mutase n=1 Tax=Cupriavidus basilensis TaxID=68895 RepID=UPI0039F6E647
MTDIQPPQAELLELRKSIDNIDAAMVHLLAERFRCTRQVGALKARHNLPPTDPAREHAQVQRLRSLAETAGLDPEFAQAYLAFVISEVIRHHKEVPREMST